MYILVHGLGMRLVKYYETTVNIRTWNDDGNLIDGHVVNERLNFFSM